MVLSSYLKILIVTQTLKKSPVLKEMEDLLWHPRPVRVFLLLFLLLLLLLLLPLRPLQVSVDQHQGPLPVEVPV
jgi:hypothetical protein